MTKSGSGQQLASESLTYGSGVSCQADGAWLCFDTDKESAFEQACQQDEGREQGGGIQRQGRPRGGAVLETLSEMPNCHAMLKQLS